MWTKESLLRLHRMAAAGFTYSEAAAKLGRTRSAIAGKAKRLGLRFHGGNPGHGGVCGPRPKPRPAIIARDVVVRSITAEFCGDPPPGRSALDGWQQRGQGYCDASHFDSSHSVRKRKGVEASE